ncbi:alpha/beta hydrolase [Bacillus paramycoides]|uniref:alpha/beta hydrolase n=1 Tax=Bacillus paramycoides TaxID=2026194 RepID=UPI003D0945D7
MNASIENRFPIHTVDGIDYKFAENETDIHVLDLKGYKEIMLVVGDKLKESKLEEKVTSDVENQEPDVAAIRASMGWPQAVDIAENPLVIENTLFGDVPVRTYVKEARQTEVLPAILFIHGGAFFGGSLENADLPCRCLADLGDVRVISVDYGLAPEFPYPKGINDIFKTLIYMYQNHEALHINRHHINVMGDSAGGNLTHVISHLDRVAGTCYVKNAVSLYPAVYLGYEEETLNKIYDLKQFVANNPEEKQLIDLYVTDFRSSSVLVDQWYIKDTDPESWMVSPYNLSNESLKVMPRTLIMTAEFDALRPQTEVFYHKAKHAGADFTYMCYGGMLHAFMDKIGDFNQAEDCLKEAIHFIFENKE